MHHNSNDFATVGKEPVAAARGLLPEARQRIGTGYDNDVFIFRR